MGMRTEVRCPLSGGATYRREARLDRRLRLYRKHDGVGCRETVAIDWFGDGRTLYGDCCGVNNDCGNRKIGEEGGECGGAARVLRLLLKRPNARMGEGKEQEKNY